LNTVCGIETWLTRLGIGTDSDSGAAAAGELNAVAATSKAKLPTKRIVLNSPMELDRKSGSLTLALFGATGRAHAARIFDQRLEARQTQ
jgi:hypothetical protein